MAKKKVTKQLERIDCDFLCGSVNDVSSKIEELKRKYAEYDNLKFDFMYSERWETDIALYGDHTE